MKFTRIILIIASVFLLNCSGKIRQSNRIPVLEVNGDALYQDELTKIIPASANKIDSAEIADRYIKKWVTETLMYNNGERNLDNKDEIDNLVEEYRKALVIHQYEQGLIQERVSDNVSNEELNVFYNQYKDELTSEENYIKGLLLILPKKAPNLDKVREWVKKPTTKSLENLEKYSLKNAISYDYFISNWTLLNTILKKAPFAIEDSKVFVNRKSYSEVSDSSHVYMLRITDAIVQGQPEPLDMAKEKIKNIILNKRKSDYIVQIEKDVYDDAVKKNKIKYYNKISN